MQKKNNKIIHFIETNRVFVVFYLYVMVVTEVSDKFNYLTIK